MVNPTRGQLYPASKFYNLGNTYHDFFVLSVDGQNNPVVTFQAKGTNAPVQSCRINDSNPSTGYVVQEGSEYRFVTYSNVSARGMVYMDAAFRAWITANGVHMFDSMSFVFTSGATMGKTGTYTHMYVCKGPGTLSSTSPPRYVHEVYTDQWLEPSVGADYSGYVSGIGSTTEVRFFTSAPSFYDTAFQNGVRGALGLDPAADPEAGLPRLVIADQGIDEVKRYPTLPRPRHPKVGRRQVVEATRRPRAAVMRNPRK